MLSSSRKCATYTMTLWSASHCSNMVVIPVATCQDLAENGLPQLMPSLARPRFHVGSSNKVKVISKEPRWKVQRSERLRFENLSSETNFYHLKAFHLHFIPYERGSCVPQYIRLHFQSDMVYSFILFSFLFTFNLEMLCVVDQPVIPYE